MRGKGNISIVILLMLVLTGCKYGNVDLKKNSHHEDDIRSAISNEYPYAITDTAEWKLYPEDNVFGLAASVSECGQDESTLMLVFMYSLKTDIDKRIIRECEDITGICPYDYFSFDKQEVTSGDNYYYVTLVYDSRIDLTGVSFDKWNKRCNINLSEGMTLTYCDFADEQQIVREIQEYDEQRGCWNPEHEETEPIDAYGGVKEYGYTELAVDHNEYEPMSEQDGIVMQVVDYQYIPETYNIYGEIDKERQTSINFCLSGDNQNVEEQQNCKLYKIVNDEVVDITPRDIMLVTECEDGDDIVAVSMKSSLIDELDEGDYRIEFGVYQVDFRLTIQTFTVS